jgi:RHS repeat-associated protein
VATPVFDPDGGVFPSTDPVTVTITTSTAGANIRYTLDGTDPTESYGLLIAASTGTVSVTPLPYGGTDLKAIAFKPGWAPSYVYFAKYSLYQECLWCPPPPGDLNAISPGGTGEEMSASTINGETSTPSTNGAAPIAVYLYAGDQIIENVTTGHFYYQDSLGNTSHVTDSAGNLLERYTYSAFGTPTILSANNTQLSTSAYGIKHLFQGQLWTHETGLNDYRNRVAFPTMGVFLQPDPIGFKSDALNLYRFCTNNAVNRTDPDGLASRATGSTIEERLRLFYGDGRGGSLYELAHQNQPAGTGGGGEGGVQEGARDSSSGGSPVRNQPGKPDYAVRSIGRAYARMKGDTHVARVFWRIQLFHYNQVPLGRGIQVRESIKWSEEVDLKAKEVYTSEQPTRDDGSVNDTWKLTFSSPNGQVKTTQTIYAGGREATWDATVHANGKVEAQQYVQFTEPSG